MITGGEILAVTLITLVLTALFFYGFRRTGPWGSFWTFLLIVFLSVLLADIWLTPMGPVWWGAAWIDLIFIGLLVALILAAASPTSGTRATSVDTATKADYSGAAIAVGIFFWLLVIFLVVAIAAGFFV